MSRQDANHPPIADLAVRAPRPLNYGRPETPMPAGIQWLLGVPLGLVVVTVVGVAVTTSQGAMPGVSAALTAFGVLGLWVIRLRRDGYYRALAAAICTGAAAALTVVGALIKSINWG